MTLIDDRFQILKRISQGGMGRVYKVKDLLEKRILALKILPKRLYETDSVFRFQQEFKVLAQFEHPNLCRVFEYGTLKGGYPYFTMEFLQGYDLYRATDGLPYEKIYPLIVQVCRALEYIHSKGLIHCDLKPENIIVSGDLVKLVDFGLVEESNLGPINLRGTFPYIAPEVIKGIPADHRVDLYSLGIIFYEITARKLLKNKLKKKNSTRFLQDYLSLIEELPKEIDKNLPENLASLVKRLIAIKVTNRFSRANEVIIEINKISGQTFALATKETQKSYFLTPPLIGRKNEMEELRNSFERKKSCLFLIGGETGTGKSKLLQEFKSSIQLRGARCITTDVNEGCGSYGLFYKFFKELHFYINKTSINKKTQNVLAELYPDILPETKKKKLSDLEIEQIRIRRNDILYEFIKDVSSKIPNIVVFLENLHWADRESLLFLEYLSRNIEDLKMHFYGTYRTEEMYSNNHLKQLIKNLKNNHSFFSIILKPLNLQEICELLYSLIPECPKDAEFNQKLLLETGGNPLFIIEILRTLVIQEGIAPQEFAPEIFERFSIPAGLEDILLRRLTNLSPEALEIIKMCAVFRKEISVKIIESILGRDVAPAIYELKKQGFIFEEERAYYFVNNKLKEVIYSSLLDNERKTLHQRIAQYLEIHYKENPRILDDLAYHYLNSGNPDKMRYGLYAAAINKKQSKLEEAIKFYKMLLDVIPKKDKKLRFAILKVLGQSDYEAGFYKEAFRYYLLALRTKPPSKSQQVSIYNEIGMVCDKMGKPEESLRYYKKGLMILKENTHSFLKAEVLTGLGLALTRKGEYMKAEQCHFQALESVNTLAKRSEINKRVLSLKGEIFRRLGIIAWERGDLDKTMNYYNNALRLYRRLGKKNKIGLVLTNIGLVTTRLKTGLKKGLDVLEQALECFEEVHNQGGIENVLLNLGCLYGVKSEHLQAIEYFERAKVIERRIGVPVILANLNLGNCYMAINEYKKAREYYNEALEFSKKTGDRQMTLLVLLNLGILLVESGEYSEGLKLLKSLQPIFNKNKQLDKESFCLNNLGILFIELGEFDTAEKYLKKSLEIALTNKIMLNVMLCMISLCRYALFNKKEKNFFQYFKKGTELARELEDRTNEAIYFTLSSEFNYQTKNYEQGILDAKRAIEILKEMNNKRVAYADALISLAKNMLRNRTLTGTGAIIYAKEAMGIAEKFDQPETKWKAYFTYGQFCKEEGNLKEALIYIKKALEVLSDVSYKLKRKYKNSYINRSDRQEVFKTLDEIEASINRGQFLTIGGQKLTKS